MVAVPFLDLRRHHEPIADETLDRWTGILESGAFVSGKWVSSFERKFAQAHGVSHAVAVSNGTVALEIIWRALGIGPGDRIVVPVSTFVATAEAVSNVGATPLFVDCEPGTGNIDVGLAVDALDEPDVRGICAVHLYGQPADLDPLMAAAEHRGAFVVEDAAQAHGATYRGRPVGGLGVAAGFSFYPGKNLGAPGEGGAVTTDSDDLAERVRMLVDHGQRQKYVSDIVGTNARMPELMAAMLDLKVARLGWASDGRRRVADLYRAKLEGVPGISLPIEHDTARSVYHLFVVEVDERSTVMRKLAEAGIGHGLHYPTPLHLQPAYSHLGLGPGTFPVAEARAERILSLPMFPEMDETQVDSVVDAVVGALGT